jgi:hypothetical protein
VLVVIEWLKNTRAGFSGLDEAEIRCVQDFMLLWSLFEFARMDRRADPTKINAHFSGFEFTNDQRLTVGRTIGYFRDRYYRNGTETRHFPHLGLTANQVTTVWPMLTSTKQNAEDEACAALHIIYRFRNNLFHGEKWAYHLQDQRSNFDKANLFLMAFI